MSLKETAKRAASLACICSPGHRAQNCPQHSLPAAIDGQNGGLYHPKAPGWDVGAAVSRVINRGCQVNALLGVQPGDTVTAADVNEAVANGITPIRNQPPGGTAWTCPHRPPCANVCGEATNESGQTWAQVNRGARVTPSLAWSTQKLATYIECELRDKVSHDHGVLTGEGEHRDTIDGISCGVGWLPGERACVVAVRLAQVFHRQHERRQRLGRDVVVGTATHGAKAGEMLAVRVSGEELLDEHGIVQIEHMSRHGAGRATGQVNYKPGMRAGEVIERIEGLLGFSAPRCRCQTVPTDEAEMRRLYAHDPHARAIVEQLVAEERHKDEANVEELMRQHTEVKAELDELKPIYVRACEHNHRLTALLGGLDAALPDAQKDLAAYAKRWESGAIKHEMAVCGVCEKAYMSGEGHHGLRCPECNPRIVTFEQLLTDRKFWPGHAFFWADHRGPRGRWVLSEDNFAVKRSELTPLYELLPENADSSRSVWQLFGEEMKRLRAIAREVAAPIVERAEASAKSAAELADKLTQTERQLREVRADRDELRDKLDERR